MKIELKHLAPYLPYGLKFIWAKSGVNYEMCGLNIYSERVLNAGSQETFEFSEIKPILRPLSDLDKTFVCNGKEYNRRMLMDYFMHSNGIYTCERIITNRICTNTLKWLDAKTLLEFHFDIFGLIEAGLAININDLTT